MTNQITLLPCPFCGGKADPEGWSAHLGSTIINGPACDDCVCCANTVEQWNNRTPKIKPLIWKAIAPSIVSASTPFDTYDIKDRGANWTYGRFRLLHPYSAEQAFPTLEAAQQAAWDDYQARITQALEVKP